MTNKNVVEMIDEYLLEPNNINKEWIEALGICRKLLIEKIKHESLCKTETYKVGEQNGNNL